MKKLLLGITILFSANTFCQDLITTQAGEEIQAKVLSINEKDISYKKFDNLDGPYYTILKKDIFVIVYKNGKKESFAVFKENTSVKSNDVKQENVSQQTIQPISINQSSNSNYPYNQPIIVKERRRFGSGLIKFLGVITLIGIIAGASGQ
jgi:uncharacterized membrane protein